MKKGEELSLQISCVPNDKNPRDLDIAFKFDFDGEHSTLHKKQDYKLR